MNTRCEVDELFVHNPPSTHADLGIRARERKCTTSQESILRLIHSFAFIGGVIHPTSHIVKRKIGEPKLHIMSWEEVTRAKIRRGGTVSN